LAVGLVSRVGGGAGTGARGPGGHFQEVRLCRNFNVDVDKFDYLARDCFHLGVKNSYDSSRLLNFSRVSPLPSPPSLLGPATPLCGLFHRVRPVCVICSPLTLWLVPTRARATVVKALWHPSPPRDQYPPNPPAVPPNGLAGDPRGHLLPREGGIQLQ